MSMKTYKIIFHLMPDSENIEVDIYAKSYEDACVWAKDYRRESFSVYELENGTWVKL